MKIFNKNILFAFITLILAAVAFYLYYTQDSSTISVEETGFAIEDSSAVTMIFLADKAGQSVTLKRNSQTGWSVNDKYIARADLVHILLKTMQSLQIYSPVPRPAQDNIIKQLSVTGIKCEIYMNNKSEPDKVYYVGGATPSHFGTYMLLAGSSAPFIIQIPYFSGYLTPRYTTDIYEWRDKSIFNYRFADIARVRFEHKKDPSSSFEIINTGKWTYTLQPLDNGSSAGSRSKTIISYDTTGVRIFLTNFQNVHFEDFVRAGAVFSDSVTSQKPIHIITVEENGGRSASLTTFRKGMPAGTLDLNGEPVYEDVDRMYAKISGYDELVTFQYYVFDNFARRLKNFSPVFVLE